VFKQALSQLKVKDSWNADTSRNISEIEFIRYLQGFRPENVPKLIAESKEHRFFIMEYLDEKYHNWKHDLLTGVFDVNVARRASSLLADIHIKSWKNPKIAEKYTAEKNFFDLRIEPYLITTGKRNPELRNYFEDEAQRLQSTRLALVHGDFSPKNILIRNDRIVLLDHEVACFGDPAFDVAFLLNHLFLKELFVVNYLPTANLVKAVWNNYAHLLSAKTHIIAYEDRISKLLLMLMLARVDGKSPVEYFENSLSKRNFIRSFVYDFLPSSITSVEGIHLEWHNRLKQFS
jgi:aminoglycoside phosphotransferase (APT) family kinase protein